MTETTKNTTRSKHNIFSAEFNTQTDDFLLADIPVMTDDSKLTITPLHHLVDEEDAIDRLLLNSGFNSRVDVTAPIVEPLSHVVIEPIEEFNEPTHDVTKAALIASEPDHALSHTTDTIAPLINSAPDDVNAEPLSQISIEPLIIEPLIDDDSDDFFTRVETDSVDSAKPRFKHGAVRHKKQQPAKQTAKTTTIISYAALVLALATLISTISLSLILTDLKTDVAKLTELVEIIRDDIATIAEKNR